MKNIYVAATSQHVGKTTSTLGLVALMKNLGIKVGYCKPVGQQFVDLRDLRVDKDALLFSDVMQFELDSQLHSPVILGRGATEAYLDAPNDFKHYRKGILQAKTALEKHNELVIYEGTGHPGVGSVVDLSNAEVAKILEAGVIMVVEGGVGSTIDKLNLSLAEFEQKGVPIIGVIINKIRTDKIAKVENYVGKWLKKKGLPLLGTLPYDPSLAYPLMRTVVKAIRGEVICNKKSLNNKVRDFISGSLIEMNKLEGSEDLLLVAGARRVGQAIFKIKRMSEKMGISGTPLAGIIATGEGELEEESMEYIKKHKVPLVRTMLDTFGCVIRISRIEVKINLSTPWKVKKAIELISENVDPERILEQVSLNEVEE
ncbi:MAG: AAA family ATPase [Saprospiraceae bacterium]